MLEGAQGSVHLVTHQALNDLGVLFGDFPRYVEVLVLLLAEPTQRVSVDQPGAGLVGSIGTAAVPRGTQIKEYRTFGHNCLHNIILVLYFRCVGDVRIDVAAKCYARCTIFFGEILKHSKINRYTISRAHYSKTVSRLEET